MLKSTALRSAALLAVAAGLGACGNMKNAEVNPRTVAIVKLTSAAGGTPQPNPQSPVQGVQGRQVGGPQLAPSQAAGLEGAGAHEPEAGRSATAMTSA